MQTEVIIVAAGSGSRMGSQIKKQYLPLDGAPILVRTLQALSACPSIDRMILVVSADDREYVQTLIADHGVEKVGAIVEGGQERQDSVRHGLDALLATTELVAVHDAARPLVTTDEVEAVLEAARVRGAATLGVAVKDTIKRVEQQLVSETLPRNQLFAVHTPQAFHRSILEAAHARSVLAGGLGTDDASLVEWAGYPVLLIEGNYTNIKITTPDDLIIAEALWKLKGEHVR
ncbi:2-C-methyl-D-erythritol 4-phosphate cytidylyltransferase [Tumebacillus algifaecis]|uniref:2-C-methyl-D-erythritol 4-phosphate cytidylyltransferase n=1 Tax=Tumebacillus algifaecis TaxID=1214604 RepID=A0A223D5S6_9BACL|nr:2-C-methyl-D-erythritol 4-phosphate cytidylyltransferase [Tumebacillus algifaecis]ASS76949.1 2-C-methyl-D-erythritol 4-phosphate cytidylyltransferase [Tumebacillus algifaecis]